MDYVTRKRLLQEQDERENRMVEHRRKMEALEFGHAQARAEFIFRDGRRYMPEVRRGLTEAVTTA